MLILRWNVIGVYQVEINAQCSTLDTWFPKASSNVTLYENEDKKLFMLTIWIVHALLSYTPNTRALGSVTEAGCHFGIQ